VGFNLGAGKLDRVRKAYKTSLLTGLVIGACSTVTLFTCAPWFIMCFNRDPSLVATGARAIRIIMTTFAFITVDILTVSYFQAVGRAKVSIFLSLLRQGVFFFPSIILLSRYAGIEYIWWAQPISDCVALTCSSTIALCTLRNLKRRAAENAVEVAPAG
jgi:Na+-driven multidrug efflux pump